MFPAEMTKTHILALLSQRKNKAGFLRRTDMTNIYTKTVVKLDQILF